MRRLYQRSCWAYLEKPLVVKMKWGKIYTIVAECDEEYLAVDHLGEVIIRKEDVDRRER